MFTTALAVLDRSLIINIILSVTIRSFLHFLLSFQAISTLLSRPLGLKEKVITYSTMYYCTRTFLLLINKLHK